MTKSSRFIQTAIQFWLVLVLCLGTIATVRAAGSTTALLNDDTWVDESWVGNNDDESDKSNWVVLISTRGTFTMPGGTYLGGVNPGLGLQGKISIPVSKHAALGGFAGTMSLPTDIEAIDFSSQQYALFVEGLLPSDRDKNLGYINIGLGFTTFSFQQFSKTHFMIPAELGVVLWFANGVGIDFGLGYNLIFPSAEDQYGNHVSTSAYEIQISAGLTFGVPRTPNRQ